MIFKNKTVGGILLVAGTSIGAGMLALPLTTGAAGLWPSLSLFGICFVFMLMSLFATFEANLYEKSSDANIISMAKSRLGGVGQAVAWVSFLLLLYSVAAAYTSGGGSIINNILQQRFFQHLPSYVGMLTFTVLFGMLVYLGTGAIDKVNRILMIGLIVSYIALVVFVSPHVQPNYFHIDKPFLLLPVVPIVILSFTSHLIVPSLRSYLQGNVPKLKVILLIGSIVPLAFYILWQILILGVLPPGVLQAIGQGDHPIGTLAATLHTSLHLRWVSLAFQAFSFFALVTSFLGVTLSLFDFLADGLGIQKNRGGRLRLLLITLVPPLAFALYFPTGFVLAISYAGVFVAILYGILPALMLWKARYVEKLTAKYRLPGGVVSLFILLVGASAVIVFQLGATLHWFTK